MNGCTRWEHTSTGWYKSSQEGDLMSSNPRWLRRCRDSHPHMPPTHIAHTSHARTSIAKCKQADLRRPAVHVHRVVQRTVDVRAAGGGTAVCIHD